MTHIPADVPNNKADAFKENYTALTHNTDRLFIFSCDQKVEHLNADFYGPDIDPEDNDPEHLFYIASHAAVGGMATQLGLIAQYGPQYPYVNYIVKLNSKTDLIPKEQRDPLSKKLWTVDDVLTFKQETNLPIRGIGYTIYIGSEHESIMLTQAAQAVFKAHQNGLVAILWMYPRGKSVEHERSGEIIAGAAGVAATIGSDFAKIYPSDPTDDKTTLQWLAVAAQAAGKTKLICSGGEKIEPETFLQQLYDQIHQGDTAGCAVGRNIHQRPSTQAIAFANAIAGIVYDNADVMQALGVAQNY